jgi:ABC-type amino acid transport system permease subunit
MYRILGADGRQYGPVDADQLRKWVRDGRANANTGVLAEGATEWKPLSAFPEFAEAPGPDNGAASTAAGNSVVFTEEVLASDVQLSIGSCFSRAWTLVMSRFWLSVGASFVIFMLTWISGTFFVVGLLLGYVLLAGLDWMFLRLIRGHPTGFEDAFAGFKSAFVQLMLFSLVSQSLMLVGLLCCVLPGIYLMLIWLIFGPLLVLDKGFDFWPAMEVSRKVVNRHFWKVLLFFLVSLLVLLAGVLCFVVGFFLALPLVTAATVYAYEDTFGSRRMELPPSPSPAPLAQTGS